MADTEELVPSEEIQETPGTSTDIETPEVTEGESGTPTTIPEEVPPETIDKSGVQKRINKLTSEKYQYKRDVEDLTAELEQLKVATPISDTGKPTLEGFDYDDDKYRDALIDYRVTQSIQTNEKQRREQEITADKRVAAKQFEKKVLEANIDGYSDAVTNLARSVPISQDLIEAIQQAENGPQLVYHLGTNLDIADRLVGKTPLAAAIELGKISATLTGKPIKKISGAAPPVQRTQGASTSAKNYNDMTMEEFYNNSP